MRFSTRNLHPRLFEQQSTIQANNSFVSSAFDSSYLVGELIWQYSPVPDHVGRFGEGLVGAVDSRLDEMAQSAVVEVVEHVGDCVQLAEPGTLQKNLN